MKQRFYFSAVILILVLSMLCFADKPASKYRIQKLVTDLNNKPETNKSAQVELIEIGRLAVPALLSQVQLYVDPTPLNCAKSARALRVLRQMRNPSAIPLANEILTKFTVSTKGMASSVSTGWFGSREAALRDCKNRVNTTRLPLVYQYVLQGEALDYICNLLSEKQARDVYVELVTKHTSKYYGEFPWFDQKAFRYECSGSRSAHSDDKYHASLQTYPSFLMLNVLKGIPLMIQNRDSRSEEVALHLLQKLPYQPSSYSSFFVLSKNGWDSLEIDSDSPEYGKQMLDSSKRCRMVAMRYLRELKSRIAIPDLEKLLNSSHSDERDYALATLEDITSGGSDSQIPATEIPEDDKYDKIVMRNGDTITGLVMNASVHLKTSYGAPEFQTSTINFIKMEGADSKTDSIELRNGDRLTGSLSDDTFTVKLKAGQTMPIAKKDVASMAFRRFWTEEDNGK